MTLRTIKTVITIALLVILSYSQERGFPARTDFDNCIKPNHITQHEMDSVISDFYFYVRDTYVQSAGSTEDGFYVLSGAGTGGAEDLVTHSEAHGYGMITSVLMAGDGEFADPDAKKYYDGMFYMFDEHRSQNSPDLMSWQILDNGSGGERDTADYSATDGDMDIAYSLILAHYQWGSDGDIDYLGEAEQIISSGIKVFDMNPENMRTMLGDWVYYFNEETEGYWLDNDSGYWEDGIDGYWVPEEWVDDVWEDDEIVEYGYMIEGYWVDGNWIEGTWIEPGWTLIEDFYWGTRASDWMTGHMHTYAEITDDPFWTEAADTIYSLLENFTENYSPNTGLVSDFVDGESGAPVPENYIDEFLETNQYFENACRIPLRLAADYAHHGSSVAQSTVNGMLDFIRTKTDEDPSEITFGYDIETGEELYPNRVSTRFTSPFIAGAIVSDEHQQYLNDGWDFISVQKESYYSDYLNLLSMLLISGNWWAPVEEFEVAIEEPAFASMKKSVMTHSMHNGTLNITLDGVSYGSATVQLFSINGREISSTAVSGNAIAIPTTNLASGIYFLSVKAGDLSITERISIQ